MLVKTMAAKNVSVTPTVERFLIPHSNESTTKYQCTVHCLQHDQHKQMYADRYS